MTYRPEQRARDWLFIWGSAEGRRAIADLFDSCGVFKPSVVPTGDIDPIKMAFNEGRRNVALDIIQALSVKPEDFRRLTEAMMEQYQDE